jgi:hypothetical protein
MKRLLLTVLAVLLLSAGTAWAAQVFAVDPPQNSKAGAPPTMTLLYSVDNPQVTIIGIPGGEGHLGLTETSTSVRNQTALMLENLAKPGFSALRTNVVIFDSPYEIFPYSLRKSADHLDRIESVIRFYKNKFNTPIWLLGHSWGSVSVSELINRSPEAQSLLAGVITSGSLWGIEVKDGVNLPILFLHHEQDGCKETPYSYAQRTFATTKSKNKGVTEFATVKGGQERGNPCRDGHHMYLSAYDDAARLVEQFIARNNPVSEKN